MLVAYYNRGCAFYDDHQYDKAIADYTKAISINPKFADGYIGRAYAYAKKGEDHKADADFAEAKRLVSK
jgi:tetratricopeptide (TPR) repeat protein